MAVYQDSFSEGARGVGTVGLVRIAGALASVGLVIGLGLWGYRLAVRDVMGVPVVRALDGAMRVAPAAPGGTVTDHQGLAVNDVAALGVATPLPDSLTLAPRAVELAVDDVAGLVVDEEAALLTASAGLDDPAALLVPQASPDAVALAMADVGGEAAARLAPVEVAVAAPGPVPEDAIAAAVAAVAAETEAATGVVAVATTLRPMRRPQGLVMAQPVLVAAPTPEVTETQDVSASLTPEVDAATLAVGTPLVQLGAFDTADDARAEWAKLALRFPDLSARSMVVQAATSGGQTFYRLRAAGFDNDDLSRKFCTDLLAANAACIPVAHR